MSQHPLAGDRDEDETATRKLNRANAALPQEFGRYHDLRPVEERSTGTVYRARDTSLAREVLLLVPALLSADNSAVERFVRAARAAAAVSHPNLCPILDAGEHQGIPYLTMPVLEGRPLATVLASDGPWPPARAADLVRKLALAMQAAHQKKVLHRDLSAACVLLTPNGEPILTDFGLARQEGSARLTVDGQVLGTPGYLAPEVLAGKHDLDGPPRDIYALGALLYELLTGQLPHGRTIREVIVQSARLPQPPSHHRQGIPAALDAVCLKALARNPAERYRGMADFARALQGCLTAFGKITGRSEDDEITTGLLPGVPVNGSDDDEKATRILPAPTAKPPVIRLAARDIRRHRRWPILLGSTVVLAGLVAGWLFLRSGSAGPQLPTQPIVVSSASDKPLPERAVGDKSLPGVVTPTPRTSELAPGLFGEYFQGIFFNRRILTRVDDQIDWNWYGKVPAAGLSWQYYSVRWTGFLKPPSAGRYLLAVDSDDGERLWLDDKIVVDDWTHHGARRRQASVELTAKPHRIRLDYHQQDGAASVRLLWRPPDATKFEVIPAKALGHDPVVSRETESKTPAVVEQSAWAINAHKGPINTVAFLDGEKQVLTVGQEGQARLWEAKSGRPLKGGLSADTALLAAAIIPGTRQVVTGGQDGSIRLWDLDKGAEVRRFTGHVGPVWKVLLADDGRRLVTAGEDKTIRLWDVASGKESGKHQGGGPVNHLATSLDGKRLLSAGYKAPLRFWNGDNSSILWEHPSPAMGSFTALALAPDASWVVIDRQLNVVLWDPKANREVRELKGHLSWTLSIVSSLDGKRILTGGWDTSVRLWDIATGKELKAMLGHRERVQSVAFSPDGKQAVSGGRDGTMRLWNLPP